MTTLPATISPTLIKQRKEAERIIKRSVVVAVGCGLIPTPLVDAVAVTALEVKMIDELADAYGFPFPSRLAAAKALISMIGSIGPIYLASHSKSAFKAIPFAGQALSATIFSTTNGIAVFAVGKIFQSHFESGGTLLSRDNKLIKKMYQENYQQAKRVVPKIVAAEKNKKSPSTTQSA